MSIFLNFLYVWLLLAILAVILVNFRNDKKQIFYDIHCMLYKHNFFYCFLSMLALYFVFPFTIPYSILYFLNKKK